MPVAEKEGDTIVGAVLYVDRFGNVVTNIPPSLVSHRTTLLRVGDCNIPLFSCYGDVGEGELLAVTGSCGFIEFSINGGNAAERLGLKTGDTVFVG